MVVNGRRWRNYVADLKTRDMAHSSFVDLVNFIQDGQIIVLEHIRNIYFMAIAR